MIIRTRSVGIILASTVLVSLAWAKDDAVPPSNVDAQLAAINARLDALEGLGAPTTMPASSQTQLRAALSKLAALEQRIRVLEARPVTNVAGGGAAATTAAPAAAADLILPKGTKLTGTLSDPNGSHVMNATVMSRTDVGAVIRMTNDLGTRDWDIRIEDGKAALVATHVISSKFGNTIKDIVVSGTASANSLKLDGSWTWQNANRGGRTDMHLDLTVD